MDRNKQLQELSNSNYEIAEGQPDIRGWDIKSINGKKLGRVKELIFDVERRKVRYIVLDLKDNEWNLSERKVLIPIGMAELHDKDNEVILRDSSGEIIQALPEYEKDTLNTNFETTIRNIFTGTGTVGSTPALSDTSADNADFYAHDHFNDNWYSNRKSMTSADEYIRMRQEPSFLESEGSNHREIDDDIDEMREEGIEMEERDAIPVTNSNTLRAGNDIDEWDTTDDNTPPRTDTESKRDDQRQNNPDKNMPNG